jgi:hypothetical protein
MIDMALDSWMCGSIEDNLEKGARWLYLNTYNYKEILIFTHLDFRLLL